MFFTQTELMQMYAHAKQEISCIPAKYTGQSCTAILISYNQPIFLYITSHIEYGKKNPLYNNIICLFYFIFLFIRKEGQFGFKKEVDEKGCA